MKLNLDETLSAYGVSEEELIECLKPYISKDIPANSNEGKMIRRTRAKNILHMLLKSWSKQLTSLSRERVGSKVQNNHVHASIQNLVNLGFEEIKHLDVLPKKPKFKYAALIAKVCD